MKNKVSKVVCIILLITAVILCVVFSACSVDDSDYGAVACKVVIADSEVFTADTQIKSVNRGEDAVFQLRFKNGYNFGSVNYKDFITQTEGIDTNGVRTIVLTVKNIKYPVFLEIQPVEVEKLESIQLVSGDNFSCDRPEQTVQAGSDLTFELTFNTGYTLSYINYSGDYTISGENEILKLLLNDIQKSERITVVTKAVGDLSDDLPDSHAFITYNAGSGGSTYTKAYIRRSGFRINTDIAAEMPEKEGYVLRGWNTSSEGRGKHVGLGSRSDVKNGARQQLYAEWSKDTAITGFSYKYVSSEPFDGFLSAIANGDAMTNDLNRILCDELFGCDYVIITGYNGNAETLTVPEKINGMPVIGINIGAVNNAYELKTLILPPTVRYIAHTAFNYCRNLKEVYLFDNIDYIHTYAFGATEQCVETLHVNAALPPVYTDSENGQFSNKIDMLINHNTEKSKIICFGSCSTWYGLNAKDVTKAFSNKYIAYNMGIIGGANTQFQLDLMHKYTNKNDVFIYNTELGSDSHMLCLNDFDRRVFTMVEGNYDLLSKLNMKDYNEVWTSFSKYVSGKRVIIDSDDYVRKGYDIKIDYINEYGDMIKQRQGGYDNEGTPYEFLSLEFLKGHDTVGKLNSYYEKFTAQGVKTFFGYGPINEQGINTAGELYFSYDSFFGDGFAERAVPVTKFMNLEDCAMDRECFYDENYHLSNRGAEIYTDYFIGQLKKYTLY